jgi:triacylglycerol lipase
LQKPAPVYSVDLVLHPAHDTTYVHFEHAATHPFQPDPKLFPRVNAWWLAESALLSYWSPQDAIPLFRASGLESEYIKKGSTDCYVAWQQDWLVVAFRGTEPDEWADVLTDANLPLVPWSVGHVHRGFKKALEDVWPTLEPVLGRQSEGRTVWFCGHSLGAALATLAADRYPAARGVCTFGSPRVGDRTFAAHFNAKMLNRTLRYVNDHDVVTHVPPPLGYRHVDVRRFIAPDGDVSDGGPALAHFFTDLIGRPQQLLETINGLGHGTLQTAPVFLLDHMPMAYAVWTWNDYDANG